MQSYGMSEEQFRSKFYSWEDYLEQTKYENKHLRQESVAYYQSFYTKRKKGKNKSWNAKQEIPIDKSKSKGD